MTLQFRITANSDSHYARVFFFYDLIFFSVSLVFDRGSMIELSMSYKYMIQMS